MQTPNSRSSPCSVRNRAVRVASHVERSRCKEAIACCSSVFTGTAWRWRTESPSDDVAGTGRDIGKRLEHGLVEGQQRAGRANGEFDEERVVRGHP